MQTAKILAVVLVPTGLRHVQKTLFDKSKVRAEIERFASVAKKKGIDPASTTA